MSEDQWRVFVVIIRDRSGLGREPGLALISGRSFEEAAERFRWKLECDSKSRPGEFEFELAELEPQATRRKFKLVTKVSLTVEGLK